LRLASRVRLHILTGFLGSGKSTLLRRYLHECTEPRKVAVLINEFGSVAIDHTLVRAYANHSQALAGGCACCDGDAALQTSLLETLRQMAGGDLEGVRDIVLETSGVSDPSRILGTIAAEMHLAEYIDVVNCVTVVESGTDEEFIGRFPELHNQLACASRIVVSKADLRSAETTHTTVALVRKLNPLAEVVVADVRASLDNLFAPAATRKDIPALSREHNNKFHTFQVSLASHISWPEFSVWLTAMLHCHGERILRFKGVIPLPSTRTQALVLQGVRHRVYEPEHLDLDPERAPVHFGLVFICTEPMEDAILASLQSFASSTILTAEGLAAQ
jgi:G3E family GTPase